MTKCALLLLSQVSRRQLEASKAFQSHASVDVLADGLYTATDRSTNLQADVGVQVREACLPEHRFPREAELKLRLLKYMWNSSKEPIL